MAKGSGGGGGGFGSGGAGGRSAVTTSRLVAALLAGSVAVSSLDFSREGYRAPLTAYHGVAPGDVNAVATGRMAPPGSRNPLPAIKLNVYPKGVLHSGKQVQLQDGRHRLQAAQQAGATHIRAEITERGARGGIKGVTTVVIPVPK